MKLSLLLTSIFLILCGCATPIEFVRKNPKKQAVVRYVPPAGSDYKAEVIAQATKFCKGEYKINNEYQAMSDSSSPICLDTGAERFSLSGSENRLVKYDYVEFVCK